MKIEFENITEVIELKALIAQIDLTNESVGLKLHDPVCNCPVRKSSLHRPDCIVQTLWEEIQRYDRS